MNSKLHYFYPTAYHLFQKSLFFSVSIKINILMVFFFYLEFFFQNLFLSESSRNSIKNYLIFLDFWLFIYDMIGSDQLQANRFSRESY